MFPEQTSMDKALEIAKVLRDGAAVVAVPSSSAVHTSHEPVQEQGSAKAA